MRVISVPWLSTIVFVVSLSLVAPLLTAGATAQAGDKILRVQHYVYPDVVDPQKLSFTNEIDIAALVYEGLTRLDANQQTVPAAAESWDYNDDATRITFHLRPDLTYSDGSPLSAEHFRYAVERACDPLTAGSYQSLLFGVVGCAEFAGLAMDEDGTARDFTDEEYETARAALGARVLDARTLQIDLTAPAPYFHTIAYTWVFYPVKQEIVAADPDNWWQSPRNHVGNGPFTVSAIVPGQEWRFVANPSYWQGRPKLDGIAYVYTGESAIALAAYRAGDLDIIGLEPTLLPEIMADPALAADLLEYPMASTFHWSMALGKEPFTDVKVREAFAYAFDRETFCTEILAGNCEPAYSWIPPGVPGAIETDRFAFDPDAAREALAASSYGGSENLPEITLTYIVDVTGETERAEWVAGQYRDILGIEFQIEGIDGTTLNGLTKDAATHPQLVMFGGWIQDYPDPQNWLSVFWACHTTFAQQIGFCHEEFDRLVALGDATVDQDERLAYYEEAGRILVDEQPGPFLFNLKGRFLVKPNITGITPTATEAEWPGSLSSLMTIDKR